MRAYRFAAWAFALLALSAFCWEAAHRGLTPGSESRYAEIAREMWETGDWLTPRYYRTAHLHKPPVSYWLTGLGYSLLGVSEAGARLFLVLAALLGLWATWSLGRLVLGGRAGALAPAILASSGLWLMMGQTVTTDMYLAAATAGAYLALVKSSRAARPLPYALAFWLLLALSVLIKAQAGLLAIAFPAAAWLWLERERSGREVLARLSPRLGLLVFAAVALPWFAVLAARHPGLLGYWLRDHLWARFFVEAKFERGGPLYYYLPILAAGFFPWSLRLLPALKRGWREGGAEGRLLVLWAAVPFVIFSLSRSKLPPYLLPVLPPLALLAARDWLSEEERAPALALRGALGLLGVALLVCAAAAAGRGLLPPGVPERLLPVLAAMPAAAGLALAGALAARAPGRRPLAFGGLAAGTALLFLCGLEGSRRVEAEAGSLKPLAEVLRGAVESGAVLAEYQHNTGSAGFYSGRVPLLWREHIELVLHEDRRGEGARAMDSREELERAAGDAPLLVLARRGDAAALAREPGGGRLLASSGPFVLLELRPGRGAQKAPRLLAGNP